MMQFKVQRASDGKKKAKDAPCNGAFKVGDAWHIRFLAMEQVVDLVRETGHTITISLNKGDELAPILTINDK